MTPRILGRYVLTAHAKWERKRRGLTRKTLANVLKAPEQRLSVRPGRQILQSRVDLGTDQVYLVRIVVDVDRSPPEIVTVYRTSKIRKYWRPTP